MIIINIIKDFKSFLFGKKQYTFYFQTLTFGDSMLSLWFFFLRLFGLNPAKKSRELFLDEVYKLFKFKNGFLFGSARSSLFTLLKALNYDEGSEVLVTGFTCEVVPNAIINAGYSPVYVDINPVNYCMNPRTAEKLITERTKAIIIQHTFGIPAQIDELIAIAKRHDLYIIEDCAVSLGSKYKDQLTGTFGDASIFSFELSKTITSCWGGMLLLNTNKNFIVEKMIEFYKKVPEQKRIDKLKTLFQLGISGILYRPRIYLLGKYIVAIFFKLRIFSFSTSLKEKKGGLTTNYLVKLSFGQAKIIHRQFLRLNEIIESNNFIKNKYLNELSNQINKDFIKIVSAKDVSLIRFPVLVDNRNKIKELFKSNNIELGLWFTAPLSSPTVDYDLFQYIKGSCVNSERICDSVINIPLINSDKPIKILKEK